MNQDFIEDMIALQAHEMGTDAAGRAEQVWLAWCDKVEKLYGADIDLDGNTGDGVCLDGAYEAWEQGDTPEIYLNGRKHG